MSTWKTKGLMLACALSATAFAYYAKPELFVPFKPLAEGIVSVFSHTIDDTTTSSTRNFAGKYRCPMTEKLNKIVKRSSNDTQTVSSDHKSYSVEIGVAEHTTSLPTSIHITSDYAGFDEQTLSFAWTGTTGTVSYQNHQDTFGFGDGIMLNFFDDGRVQLSSEHWLSQTQFLDNIGMCEPALSLAVFIRPCLSDSDPKSADFRSGLYKSFPSTAGESPVAMVADGTLDGVCNDLKAGGVTDVFLPFKVDDEAHSRCGHEGELLYQSTEYPDRISQSFKDAHTVGFDPIKALMTNSSCDGLRFHAWVPIFKDPKIIADLREQGIEARQYAKPLGLDFLPFAYYSDLAANPGIAGVQEYAMNLLVEILNNYPVDGVNFDYIRYTDEVPPYGYFWVKQPSAIVDFVGSARERVLRVAAGVTISADIWPRASDRDSIGQDLDGISEHVDILMPMEYTGLMVYDREELETTLAEMITAQPSKSFMPILRGWKSGGTPILDDLSADFKVVKKAHTSGYGIFTYESFMLDQQKE